MLKQYSVDELKVGMNVKYEELDAIYGVWIYLDTYMKKGVSSKSNGRCRMALGMCED